MHIGQQTVEFYRTTDIPEMTAQENWKSFRRMFVEHNLPASLATPLYIRKKPSVLSFW
jgi:hypothetical protein